MSREENPASLSDEVRGPGAVAFWPRPPWRHTPSAKPIRRCGRQPAWTRRPPLDGAVRWDFSRLDTAPAPGVSLDPRGAAAAELGSWVPPAHCLWLLVVRRGGGPATLGQVDPVAISCAACRLLRGWGAGGWGLLLPVPLSPPGTLSNWLGVDGISSYPFACSQVPASGQRLRA